MPRGYWYIRNVKHFAHVWYCYMAFCVTISDGNFPTRCFVFFTTNPYILCLNFAFNSSSYIYSPNIYHTITVTSWWARWRFKSPASRLFIQPVIQAQIKENIKALRHWLCEGNSPVTGEFPAQRASNAKMFPFHDVIVQRPLQYLLL